MDTGRGCGGEFMRHALNIHAKPRALLLGAVIERLEPRRLLATTTVSLPAAPRDIAFDNSRNLLYITESNGTIARYDLGTKALLSPWTVGGSLNGLDITPNNSAIYVADGTTIGS